MANYFGPYDDEEEAPAPDAVWAARRSLASALRQLNELTISSVADAVTLASVAEQVTVQVERLSQCPQAQGKMDQIDPQQDYASQRSIISHEISPLTGLSNPLSPPLNIWFEDDKVKGRVTMGWQFEGPPACVHGGYIAALFDDFLGVGQKLTGQIGFTGTLKIRYLKPTPLEQELNLVAWLERQDGRKTTLRGEMYAGDLLTASCEALFIQMPSLSYRDGDDVDKNTDESADEKKRLSIETTIDNSEQLKRADQEKTRP